MNELISIVIPIYNSQDKIEKCLNSIVNQSYKNLEIILINDGSTDNSEEICKIFKEKDSRIIYIKKKNSGAADTRNQGIKISNGKYIIFIDSDDYISNDYIEKMYNTMKKNNVGIAISGYTEINEDGTNKKISLFNKYEKVYYFNEYINDFINYAYFTCVKMLIEKEKIKNIRFNKKLKFGEDILFAFNLLKNNCMVYTGTADYFYVQNQTSVTHDTSVKAAKEYIENNKVLYKQISKESNCKEETISNRLLTKLNISARKICENKKIKYHSINKFLKEYEYIIDAKEIKLKNIDYISKSDKIRVFLLHKKNYLLYYLYNKLINRIRKK